MRFAKVCFTIAGSWGLISLIPLFFVYRLIGAANPPAINHPEYYFGFLCVAIAWQVAFLAIARDPLRYRLLMLPAMIEKFGYGVSCLILTAQHLASDSTAVFGSLDLLFGIAFVVAWLKSKPGSARS